MDHELEVHQVELELQNEELERARRKVDAACQHYIGLYEHSPIAYLTLDGGGRIVEINGAALALLGIERPASVRKHLSAFMRVADADAFHIFRKELFQTRGQSTCEISLRCDRAYRAIHLVVNVPSHGHGEEYLCALLDLSALHAAEKPLPRVVDAGVRFEATALLVDDEPRLRKSVRLMLEQLGLEVLEADGAASALQIATERDDAPDLVVSDVLMPDMNGPEVVAKLRARWPDLPVLYVSGDPGDALEMSTLGERTRLLAKPFLWTELVAELVQLLGDPNAAAERATMVSTILVVEDEAVSRCGIEKLLSGPGIRVLTAATVAEARTLAASAAIDVVLADLRLPDGTGDGLAEEIKGLQPNVSIIYMSGAPPGPTRVPGPFLEKPLDVDRLIALIDGTSRGSARRG